MGLEIKDVFFWEFLKPLNLFFRLIFTLLLVLLGFRKNLVCFPILFSLLFININIHKKSKFFFIFSVSVSFNTFSGNRPERKYDIVSLSRYIGGIV